MYQMLAFLESVIYTARKKALIEEADCLVNVS